MAVELVKLPLKGDGTEKRGGETKILKGGGKLGHGGGPLQRGRGWKPLTNYRRENPICPCGPCFDILSSQCKDKSLFTCESSNSNSTV